MSPDSILKFYHSDPDLLGPTLTWPEHRTRLLTPLSVSALPNRAQSCQKMCHTLVPSPAPGGFHPVDTITALRTHKVQPLLGAPLMLYSPCSLPLLLQTCCSPIMPGIFPPQCPVFLLPGSFLPQVSVPPVPENGSLHHVCSSVNGRNAGILTCG